MSPAPFDTMSDTALIRAYLANIDGRSEENASIVYSDSKLAAVRSVDQKTYDEWLAAARGWADISTGTH